MATITIGITGSGVANGTKTYTITDAHQTRLIAAMRVILKAQLPPNATDAQVLAAWADYFIGWSKNQTRDYEINIQTPTPIDIT